MSVADKILKNVQLEKLIIKKDYSTSAEFLHNSQINSWELMKNNFEALKKIETKTFLFDGFKINVQFNPGRIKSTSAEVDENSISSRKCFLCIENLPDEQKGISLPSNFILLCNPYPIFKRHFTISSLTHQPQRIEESFKTFLELSKLFSNKCTLIYNGPECGASAPDHLHFQAGISKAMLVEDDILQIKNDYGKIVKEDDVSIVSLIDDGLRKIILIESTNDAELKLNFIKIINSYRELSSAISEPMINILCSHDEESGWNLIIFLRSRHRPKNYYKTGTDKIVVSPAAVDLGGLIITPREEDFNKLDKEIIKQIFSEISPSAQTFSAFTKKLIEDFN
ncbi:MAG: DUF4922 domain-containing protein [Ignavibacteriales bacterium]